MLASVGQSVSPHRQLLTLARQTGAWAVEHEYLIVSPAAGVQVRKPRNTGGGGPGVGTAGLVSFQLAAAATMTSTVRTGTPVGAQLPRGCCR